MCDRSLTQSSRQAMWRAVSAVAGLLSTLMIRKVMEAGYRAIRGDSSAPIPAVTNPRVSWPDAALWAAAVGVGVGIAKMVSTRVAVAGWEAATGTLPPGLVDAPASARQQPARRPLPPEHGRGSGLVGGPVAADEKAAA